MSLLVFEHLVARHNVPAAPRICPVLSMGSAICPKVSSFFHVGKGHLETEVQVLGLLVATRVLLLLGFVNEQRMNF